jgi:hypothetical protein
MADVTIMISLLHKELSYLIVEHGGHDLLESVHSTLYRYRRDAS